MITITTTKLLSPSYCKNVVKNHPVSNASGDHNFQLQDSKLSEIIEPSWLTFKIEFLWWWECQILGREK